MNKTQATRPCTKNGVCSINRNNIEVDRISSLLDKVLTHIFSFLSTKEAVQTCVLSKRWKNTWAVVLVLNIHIKEFQNNRSGSHCYEEQRMSMARFKRFMSGFLDNRARTILERVCCVHNTVRHIGWLDRVALHMPLLIDITIGSGPDDSLDMSDLVFSCASLQHLSMALDTIQTIHHCYDQTSLVMPDKLCLGLDSEIKPKGLGRYATVKEIIFASSHY